MTNHYTPIGRRAYLRTTGIVAAGTAGIAGCLGAGSGTLATFVTDQPGDIADFESCVVTITGSWLGPEGAEAGEEGQEPSDREYFEFDDPQEADLVELQGDATQLIDERDLSPAEYAFLQLDVSGIDATLDGGEDAVVEVPGEAPLTFNERFEIRDDTRTAFTADFTPVQRGQTGKYVLQSVAQGIQVSYEDL